MLRHLGKVLWDQIPTLLRRPGFSPGLVILPVGKLAFLIAQAPTPTTATTIPPKVRSSRPATSRIPLIPIQKKPYRGSPLY